MTRTNYFLLIFLFILFAAARNFPQSDTLDVFNLDLTQLSKLKIITASKVSQSISEVPATVLVITGDEIKKNGYFTLDDALSGLPGFQFRNIQGINSYIFQRGVPNQNNLILLLIDGVQVNELNSGGFYSGGQYNLSNVERIEVVYGPASVAYGTNAISGIINIITKSPGSGKSGFGLAVGRFNTIEGNFSYDYLDVEKSFGVRLSGMFKRTDKADLAGKAGDYNWTNKMENFEKDYNFSLKIVAGDFTLGTNYIQKQTPTTTLIKSVGTIYRDYGTLWNIRFINNYLKYKKNLSDRWTFTGTVYNRNATVLDNTLYYVLDTAQVGYYRPNNLTGLESILNYDGGDIFSMTGGFTFERESLSKSASLSYSNSETEKPPTPVDPSMLHNTLVSVFIEPRISVDKNLFLSGGVRLDHSSVYDQVVTPRAGLTYNFSNAILRLSYAEAFRAPKPWDYTDGLGNPSLLPEKMKSFESSLTISPADWIKAGISGYKNVLTNAIVKDVVAGGYKWINRGEVKTDGLELFTSYKSGHLSAYVNYTFTESYNEFHDFIPEISKHTGNASVTFTFGNYFNINVRANFVGKRKNPTIITTTGTDVLDPFLIFHGTLSVINYNGFDVGLTVMNIFDKEYYHTSNRMPDRYRQSQRTVLLSFDYSFGNGPD